MQLKNNHISNFLLIFANELQTELQNSFAKINKIIENTNKMGENFNYDFRTPLQKQQDERRKNILAMFEDFRKKAASDVSDSRIMAVIAQHVGCTPQNIRAILVKAGVIVSKRKKVAH